VILFLLAFSGGLTQRITLTGQYDLVLASASAAGLDSGVWCGRRVDGVPDNAFLLGAFLFWTSGFWTSSPGRMTSTRLAVSFGDTSYVNPQRAFSANGNWVMFSDVTQSINGGINGTYWCQKLDPARGFSWCLILLYTAPGIPKRTLDLHYGCLDLGFNGDTTPWSDTFRLGVAASPPWGKFGFFSVGGDGIWEGDRAILRGHRLSNWMNPWNNVGNGSYSDPFTGEGAWMNWPWGPADADVFEVSGLFPSGTGSVPYSLTPGDDWIYYGFAFLLADETGSAGTSEEAGTAMVVPGRVFRVKSQEGGFLRIYYADGRLAFELPLSTGAREVILSLSPGAYIYTFGSKRGSFILR
jgi:hypothetical protein